MADEPDGINETFESTARVAMTAAGLLAERIARARQQAQHDAQAASEQQARELQTRLDAERGAARASLAPVQRDEWWDNASAEDIGDAWQTANAWRDVDPDADRATGRIRDELRGRYAIDVDSLDANPEASFVYSTLEAFGHEPGLRSQLPWYVPWLCAANYLDAQAMIRRDVLERHGGYRIDDEWIYGWEDWDLWLRLAVAGEHGVHIPEMLGRYRTQRTSMISMSNLAAGAMTAHLRARYPTLPWP